MAAVSPFLLVGVGGILGANARYILSTWAADRFGTAFPYGTFIVNISGSFLIGFLLAIFVAHVGNSPARLLVVTGFLGAYTTFSTFTFETMALLRQGDIRSALANALGVGGVGAGIVLAGVITGPGL